jgi:hypothetical protein
MENVDCISFQLTKFLCHHHQFGGALPSVTHTRKATQIPVSFPRLNCYSGNQTCQPNIRDLQALFSFVSDLVTPFPVKHKLTCFLAAGIAPLALLTTQAGGQRMAAAPLRRKSLPAAAIVRLR